MVLLSKCTVTNYRLPIPTPIPTPPYFLVHFHWVTLLLFAVVCYCSRISRAFSYRFVKDFPQNGLLKFYLICFHFVVVDFLQNIFTNIFYICIYIYHFSSFRQYPWSFIYRNLLFIYSSPLFSFSVNFPLFFFGKLMRIFVCFCKLYSVFFAFYWNLFKYNLLFIWFSFFFCLLYQFFPSLALFLCHFPLCRVYLKTFRLVFSCSFLGFPLFLFFIALMQFSVLFSWNFPHEGFRNRNINKQAVGCLWKTGRGQEVVLGFAHLLGFEVRICKGLWRHFLSLFDSFVLFSRVISVFLDFLFLRILRLTVFVSKRTLSINQIFS